MNSYEKEELALRKFTNIYKTKNFQEIVLSTLNIKSSDISSYEYTLLDIIRGGISEHLSVGMLVSRKIILERLIDNNSPAKENLIEHWKKIEVLLKR